MPESSDELLRQQIQSAAATEYSTLSVEQRIAASLTQNGAFDEILDVEEFESVLRGIIFWSFAHQTFAGVNVGMVHNVVTMDIEFDDLEAHVRCVVHIHKPIIAFIEFDYTLENDPDSVGDSIRLKEGTLNVETKTRKLDVKAKTALAAMNVRKITMQQMSDLTEVIASTLPPQLQAKGVDGRLEDVEIQLLEEGLHVRLYGTFVHLVTP
jgi:hypothetical protein